MADEADERGVGLPLHCYVSAEFLRMGEPNTVRHMLHEEAGKLADDEGVVVLAYGDFKRMRTAIARAPKFLDGWR